MTLTILPRRWNLRLHHLSETAEPTPIERLCHHAIWVRNQAGELICRHCQKVSG